MAEQPEPVARPGVIANWQPESHEEYDRLKGRTVVARDGQEVGTLCAVFHPPQDVPEARGGHYFLVESTPLEPRLGGSELYLSEQLLDRVEPDRIVLAVPFDRLSGDLVRAPRNLLGWNRS
jgi:hypothetical protein